MAKARTSAQVQAVYGGFTVTDFAHIMSCSQNDIHKRLAGRVEPISPPGVEPLRYALRDVGPYLFERKDGASAREVERAMTKMKPSQLPPALQDAYWKAQITRQEYEESKAQLWKTERVVKVLGEAFKPVAMSLRMMADTVEQMHELTPEQRAAIVDLSDQMLRSIQQSLVDQFADYVAAADEHGHELEEEKVDAVGVPPEARFDDGLSDDDDEPIDDGLSDEDEL